MRDEETRSTASGREYATGFGGFAFRERVNSDGGAARRRSTAVAAHRFSDGGDAEYREWREYTPRKRHASKQPLACRLLSAAAKAKIRTPRGLPS